MSEEKQEDAASRTPPAGKTDIAQNGGDRPKEVGGRVGPEPTRYGDWEKNGIISDF